MAPLNGQAVMGGVGSTVGLEEVGEDDGGGGGRCLEVTARWFAGWSVNDNPLGYSVIGLWHQ